MPKLHPRALDCPSCGASLEVRNARKAKSVVCGTCTAQIDLTKPGFEVLAKPGPRAATPLGPIRLGLRATIDDKEHEIIGRLRLTERDEGEVDVWDEWLLVCEDGSYRWLSEEPGNRWALHEPFVPDPPVTPADLVQGSRVTIGDKRLLVRERGTARVSYIEGELTWKARIGDPVEYADATLGLHGYAFEWTEDEFECFTIRKVTRSELWKVLGLASAQPEATAHHERAQALRKAATLLFVGALVAFLGVLVAPLLRGAVSNSGGDVSLPGTELKGGVALGAVELQKGLGFYELETTAYMPRGMERYEVRLDGPGGGTGKVLQFRHFGTNPATDAATVRFTVPTTGSYRMTVTGDVKDAAGPGRLRWALYHTYLVGRWFVGAGILLVVLALWTFFRANKEALIASSLYYGDESEEG